MPLVQEQHLIGDLLHDAGVVLHHQQGFALRLQAAQEGHDPFQCAGRQAGGRFVQQQQLRPGRQYARHGQQFLLAIGQVADEFMRAVGQADMLQGGQGFLAAALLGTCDVPGAENRADRLLARLRRQRDQHVIQRGQVDEQAQILEGAGDTGGDDGLRGQPIQASPLEGDAALVGFQESGDNVEDRGLAGTVGANQARDAAAIHGERAIAQGQQPAETDLHPGGLQIGGAHSFSPANPCGRNSMKAISSTP